mgnify:CR=1 FL=1
MWLSWILAVTLLSTTSEISQYFFALPPLQPKNPIVEIAMLSFHAYSGDRDEVQKVHGHLISWELVKAALI